MFGGLHTPLWGKEIRIFAPVSPFQSPSEWTAATQPLKNNNNNNSNHILEINGPYKTLSNEWKALIWVGKRLDLRGHQFYNVAFKPTVCCKFQIQ